MWQSGDPREAIGDAIKPNTKIVVARPSVSRTAAWMYHTGIFDSGYITLASMNYREHVEQWDPSWRWTWLPGENGEGR